MERILQTIRVSIKTGEKVKFVIISLKIAHLNLASASSIMNWCI